MKANYQSRSTGDKLKVSAFNLGLILAASAMLAGCVIVVKKSTVSEPEKSKPATTNTVQKAGTV